MSACCSLYTQNSQRLFLPHLIEVYGQDRKCNDTSKQSMSFYIHECVNGKPIRKPQKTVVDLEDRWISSFRYQKDSNSLSPNGQSFQPSKTGVAPKLEKMMIMRKRKFVAPIRGHRIEAMSAETFHIPQGKDHNKLLETDHFLMASDSAEWL